jgi:hypothetical protein
MSGAFRDKCGRLFRAQVAFTPRMRRRSPPVKQLTELRLDQLPPQQAQFALVLLLALGLVYCFAGYPMLRVLLGLTGFLIAGAVAAALAGWLSQGNLLFMGGALLFGGICGAMALSFLYRAGVFLLGFLGALLLGFNLFFQHDAAYGPVFTIVAGLIGGILALFLEKPVMKFATAAIGGWMTTVSGMLLLASRGVIDKALQEKISPNATWVLIGVWALLTLFGAAFQFSMGKGRGKAA